jgi:hypothetical protein
MLHRAHARILINVLAGRRSEPAPGRADS